MGLHKQGISFEPSLCNSTYLPKLMMTVSDCREKKKKYFAAICQADRKNSHNYGSFKISFESCWKSWAAL